MIILIQSICICVLFTLLIYLLGRKDPIKGIMSYPPEIRARVESLPQYEKTINKDEKSHTLKKLLSIPVFAFVMSLLSCMANARTFETAFIHSFTLFFIVNLWDLVVIDWLWFCNSKRAIIPGTEDMLSVYKGKLFHFKGFIVGLLIGLVISLLSALIVHIIF